MMVLAAEWPSIRILNPVTVRTASVLRVACCGGGCVERGCVATCGETSSKETSIIQVDCYSDPRTYILEDIAGRWETDPRTTN
jgi:hypothetical protein